VDGGGVEASGNGTWPFGKKEEEEVLLLSEWSDYERELE